MGIRLATGIAKKTPDEVLKITLTYADKLATGETLASVSTSSVIDYDNAGLTIDSVVVSGALAQVTLSAGSAVGDNLHIVLVRVITTDSQTLDGAVQVLVSEATC